jgi:predicted Fe-Mo cluster-binding NifX family protein
MRIAIASHDFTTIGLHAGRARRFLLFDVGVDGVRLPTGRLDLAPEYAMHEFDDEGAHPLDGVDVLLAGSAGEGVVRKAARRGIRLVCTAETDPTRAIDDFLGGHLAPAASCDHHCNCSHSH